MTFDRLTQVERQKLEMIGKMVKQYLPVIDTKLNLAKFTICIELDPQFDVSKVLLNPMMDGLYVAFFKHNGKPYMHLAPVQPSRTKSVYEILDGLIGNVEHKLPMMFSKSGSAIVEFSEVIGCVAKGAKGTGKCGADIN